jgi:hypothetical protein
MPSWEISSAFQHATDAKRAKQATSKEAHILAISQAIEHLQGAGLSRSRQGMRVLAAFAPLGQGSGLGRHLWERVMKSEQLEQLFPPPFCYSRISARIDRRRPGVWYNRLGQPMRTNVSSGKLRQGGHVVPRLCRRGNESRLCARSGTRRRGWLCRRPLRRLLLAMGRLHGARRTGLGAGYGRKLHTRLEVLSPPRSRAGTNPTGPHQAQPLLGSR